MSLAFGFALPHWQPLSGGFSPASLFAGGTVAGAWYDPSDLSTMFTTSAGTTQCAMPGGGAAVSVGRMLDKSGNGNHAIAANDTTARPELQARVNLLTYSEQFDNGVWTKSNAAAAIITTTPDPLGGTTACEVTAIAGPGVHGVYQLVANSAIGAGVSATFSAYFRYVNNRYLRFAFVTGGGNQSVYVDIDLLNGVIVNTGPYSAATQTAQSIVSVGNGWYRVSVTGTLPSATSYATAYFRDSSSNANPESAFSFTASGTEKFLIWGADLRPANIGSAVPTYQRIADANTYDSNGFPSYLRFDGVADSMYTPASINFSGTDKMSVFAGVRKLSDAAGAILAELSASAGANNGSFYFAAPTAALPDFGFLNRGTAAQLITASPYAAPVTVVASGIGDIAGAVSAIRINGSQVGINTTSQGAGNYGTYPLYIGSRNNASLWFNGHLYSLIIAGSAVSAGNISTTEQWVANKTGIVIP